MDFTTESLNQDESSYTSPTHSILAWKVCATALFRGFTLHFMSETLVDVHAWRRSWASRCLSPFVPGVHSSLSRTACYVCNTRRAGSVGPTDHRRATGIVRSGCPSESARTTCQFAAGPATFAFPRLAQANLFTVGCCLRVFWAALLLCCCRGLLFVRLSCKSSGSSSEELCLCPIVMHHCRMSIYSSLKNRQASRPSHSVLQLGKVCVKKATQMSVTGVCLSATGTLSYRKPVSLTFHA
jgi:hypothetical protein